MEGSDVDGAPYCEPYLREEILGLNGLDYCEQVTSVSSDAEPTVVEKPAVPEAKPPPKKPTKPRWLKL